MKLNRLTLANFRSYEEATFEFHPQMTAITGANGSGKTNILEAIYLLGMTKSFRDQPAELAHTGSDWFRVEADFSPTLPLAFKWSDNRKTIELHGDAVAPGEYLGTVPVVLFEPSSMDMVRGTPSLRRAWVDRILCFSDRAYLTALVQYRRILRQRNHLLRHKQSSREQLFAWDVILSEHADYIVGQRAQFITEINKQLTTRYQSISHTQDEVEINYRSTVPIENYREKLLNELERRVERDLRFGSTSVGPHRDDIDLIYNGQALAHYGSRGENRTMVLALVLSELEYLRQHARSAPILLLDDVLSELDERRQQKLLSGIKGIQTIVTSTSMPDDIGKHARIEL